jgi:hypothetical protein
MERNGKKKMNEATILRGLPHGDFTSGRLQSFHAKRYEKTNQDWGQYMASKEQLLGITQKFREDSTTRIAPPIRIKYGWNREEVDLFFEALQARKVKNLTYVEMAKWMNNEATQRGMHCVKFNKCHMESFRSIHIVKPGRWPMRLKSLEEKLWQSASSQQSVPAFVPEDYTGIPVAEEGKLEVDETGQPALPRRANVDAAQQLNRPQPGTGEMRPQRLVCVTPKGITSFRRPNLILVFKYGSGTLFDTDEYMDVEDTGELTSPQANMDAAREDYQHLSSTGEMRPRKGTSDDRPSFQQPRLVIVLKYGLGTCSASDTVKQASTWANMDVTEEIHGRQPSMGEIDPTLPAEDAAGSETLFQHPALLSVMEVESGTSSSEAEQMDEEETWKTTSPQASMDAAQEGYGPPPAAAKMGASLLEEPIPGDKASFQQPEPVPVLGDGIDINCTEEVYMDWEDIWNPMSPQADMDTAQEECDRQLESDMLFSLLMEDTLDDKASCQQTNLMFVQDDESETSPTDDEFTDTEETWNPMSSEVHMDPAQEEYPHQPPVVEMLSSPFAECTTEIGPSFLQSNPPIRPEPWKPATFYQTRTHGSRRHVGGFMASNKDCRSWANINTRLLGSKRALTAL